MQRGQGAVGVLSELPELLENLTEPPQHLRPVRIVIGDLGHQATDPLDQAAILAAAADGGIGNLPDGDQEHLAEVGVHIGPVAPHEATEVLLRLEGPCGVREECLGI
ncbi:MAG: hypothetical protein ACR2GQ_05135 [Gemmatimonadota bacterium]